MPLDIGAVQEALRADGLDGWLLYDFHGSNPVATSLVGLAGTGKMSTRRWYYMIPANGAPQGLVHKVERHNLDELPGEKRVYAGRIELERGLGMLLAGVHRLAMEYSPGGAIPYVGRVDAGTVEFVRTQGVEVVSSGDLVQRFGACWSEEQIAQHRDASVRLYRIKDRAFEAISGPDPPGRADDRARRAAAHGGLVPRRGSGRRTTIPSSRSTRTRVIRTTCPARPAAPRSAANSSCCSTSGASSRRRARCMQTSPGSATPAQRVPDAHAAAFDAIAAARDAAIAVVERAAAAGADLRGWQVDRAARDVLQQRGYGAAIAHRTGHSLGEEVHGNGVHMDDYETHDDRRLLPGSGFTIEPGLYFDTFGVRTEINMVYDRGGATVTGPAQPHVLTLA